MEKRLERFRSGSRNVPRRTLSGKGVHPFPKIEFFPPGWYHFIRPVLFLGAALAHHLFLGIPWLSWWSMIHLLC